MPYNIEFAQSVEKQLKKISKKDASRIKEWIESLSSEPRPCDVKKLKGRELYRIRSGDYRIIYAIKDKVLLVLIVAVGHRKEIYDL